PVAVADDAGDAEDLEQDREADGIAAAERHQDGNDGRRQRHVQPDERRLRERIHRIEVFDVDAMCVLSEIGHGVLARQTCSTVNVTPPASPFAWNACTLITWLPVNVAGGVAVTVIAID